MNTVGDLSRLPAAINVPERSWLSNDRFYLMNRIYTDGREARPLVLKIQIHPEMQSRVDYFERLFKSKLGSTFQEDASVEKLLQGVPARLEEEEAKQALAQIDQAIAAKSGNSSSGLWAWLASWANWLWGWSAKDLMALSADKLAALKAAIQSRMPSK